MLTRIPGKNQIVSQLLIRSNHHMSNHNLPSFNPKQSFKAKKAWKINIKSLERTKYHPCHQKIINLKAKTFLRVTKKWEFDTKKQPHRQQDIPTRSKRIPHLYWFSLKENLWRRSWQTKILERAQVTHRQDMTISTPFKGRLEPSLVWMRER